MTILKIASTNPFLSFILAKNPATIRTAKKPYERPLRKGKIYGWFSKANDSEFTLLFKDSDIENSFGKKEGEFEYLDITRYSSPYLPLMMINTALATATKEPHEKDTEEFVTTVTTTLKAPPRLVFRLFAGKDVEVEFFPATGNHVWIVTVRAKGVMQALGVMQMVCALASISDDDTHIPLPEEGIEKYLDVLNRIEAPYHLRHMFVSRAITNRSLFTKLLPKINAPGMSLKFGNTQIQRFDRIREILASGKRGEGLFDIGCGELNHTVKLAEEYDFVTAVDEDEDIHEKNSHRIKAKKLENVVAIKEHVDAAWVKNIDLSFAGNDVLLSEVLEHMSQKDAFEVLAAVLETEANKVVVTVPCKEFNKFFDLDDAAIRHPDHKWEPTKEEWLKKMEKLGSFHVGKWAVKTLPVGDEVDGVSLSLMTVFSREGEVK